jgi:hypothetical protein
VGQKTRRGTDGRGNQDYKKWNATVTLNLETLKPYSAVILGEAESSRSEIAAQSKDPYLLYPGTIAARHPSRA